MVGIASGVNQQCPSCELEQTNITNGEFQCFPGSPNQVTFRAKVHDRAQATAREAITHIEQWITSSDVVTLPVHHARLNVNNTCVVLLASFDDPECPEYLTPPFPAINKTSVGDNIMNDPECLDGSVPISEPVHTTTSSTDETYSSTEPTKGQETTSGLTGTSIQDVPTGSTSQSMTTTNNQFITTPPLTTGIFDQGQTAQNEIEKETVSSTEDERGQQQFQFDAGAIVGGVVAIIFIITAGIVIMFVLYSILKYCQTTKQLRYGRLC